MKNSMLSGGKGIMTGVVTGLAVGTVIGAAIKSNISKPSPTKKTASIALGALGEVMTELSGYIK